jgi:hypothetical protein
MDDNIWVVTFVCDHAVIMTRVDSENDDEDVIIELATEKLLDMVGIDIKTLRIVDIEVEEVN